MEYDFEKVVVLHCSPTLIGKKPASLISISKEEYLEWECSIEEFNQSFEQLGLQIVVFDNNARNLLFLYRKKLLEEYLKKDEVKELLHHAGYPLSLTIEGTLVYLEKRIDVQEGFPHEIGVILGYPVCDVKAFVHNMGKNFRLCGYWKVYQDVTTAETIFLHFELCRGIVQTAFLSGIRLKELLAAAYLFDLVKSVSN